MTRAWYLGIGPDDVAERCILVGDPARVDVFAERMRDARLVSAERGLRTITGSFDGAPVTVAAFGMGAPIAVVVLEELAALGVRVVLRAGTAMAVAHDVPLGAFVVAEGAVREDGTSSAYAPPGFPAVADPDLNAALVDALTKRGLPWRRGILASSDAFYREMLAARDEFRPAVEHRFAGLRRLGVVAADMETAALLVVGRLLGVRAGSLCLVSVEGEGRAALPPEDRRRGEQALVEVALMALTADATLDQPS
jgi:uridine phosphorylase